GHRPALSARAHPATPRQRRGGEPVAVERPATGPQSPRRPQGPRGDQAEEAAMSSVPTRARAGFSALSSAVLILQLTGCGNASQPGVLPAADQTPGVFTDMTDSSGLRFTYRNGQEAGQFAILESLGGGVGLIDYDRDGRLDILVTGGGTFDGRTTRGYPN